MKEMLKSKMMIGFMVAVVCVSYMNGVSEKKMTKEKPTDSDGVVYNVQ